MGRERLLPPVPPNEAERLVALKEIVPELGLGDGAPEDPHLQMLCKTICKLFKVPIAAVSIVNKDTYSMRACQGLPPQFKIPRSDAFCAWTLLPKVPEIMVVEDLKEDQRFRDHPNVQPDGGGLRFYAGSPLISSNNFTLGSVCILDVGPRKMSAEEFNMLSNFSEMAIRRLEEKHFPTVKGNGKMLRAPEDPNQAVVLCDLSNSRWWSILYGNESFAEVAGVGHASLTESQFWKLFRPAGSQAKHKILEDLEEAIENSEEFTISTRRRESVLDGSANTRDSVYHLVFRPATTQNLGAHAGKISVPNIIAAVDLGGTNSSYFLAVVTKTSKPARGEPEPEFESIKSSKRRRQQTFYSKRHQMDNVVGSKQPVDEGINDVQMGVLCCQTETGLVYRGRWKRKPVSVKVIETDKSNCMRAPAFGVAYVPKEAALCIGIDQINILATSKIVVENLANDRVKAWIVRDWCGVGTLDDAITRGWFMDEEREPQWRLLLSSAIQIAQAMAFLHEESIIFGSLNAYSVQLGEEDADGHRGRPHNFSIRLQEFGWAAKSEDLVDAGKITVPSHAAPEVFAKNQLSRASDVYAFGMLWWEMVTGQLLWPSLNSEQIHKRVLAKQMPTLPLNMDSGIKAILDNCLAHKPSQRPTFQQLESRLKIMLSEFNDNKTMLGVSAETMSAPTVRRLFNHQAAGARKDALAEKTPSLEKAQKPTTNSMLRQASNEAAESQKKSMFKRFAAKFKT